MAFVPLRDASERCGAKAHNLGRLMKAGCNVPAGFVVPDPLRDAGWEVGAYTTRTGQAPVTRVPVIVQVMVQPEVAGVLFTRHR